MDYSNNILKSLNWDQLLRQISDEEYDSDETYCGENDTIKPNDISSSCYITRNAIEKEASDSGNRTTNVRNKENKEFVHLLESQSNSPVGNTFCSPYSAQNIKREECIDPCEDDTLPKVMEHILSQKDYDYIEKAIENLDGRLADDISDLFLDCEVISSQKKSSPPLTLHKYNGRIKLPRAKVLPKYSKRYKELTATKKILPGRKCKTGFIEKLDSESSNTNKENNSMGATVSEHLEAATRKKPHVLNEAIPGKKLIQRNKKKACSKKRRKGKKASKSLDLQKESVEENRLSLSDIEKVVGHTEIRTSKWISGSDLQPLTREDAFQMLAVIQSFAKPLHQLLQQKSEKRNSPLKKDKQLIKQLFQRVNNLAEMIDKIIAEADRLLDIEQNKIIVEDTSKSNIKNREGMVKSNLKPILKYNSSESSEASVTSYNKHIYFSDEVEYHFLSSGEHSSLSELSMTYSNQPETNGIYNTEEQISKSLEKTGEVVFIQQNAASINDSQKINIHLPIEDSPDVTVSIDTSDIKLQKYTKCNENQGQGKLKEKHCLKNKPENQNLPVILGTSSNAENNITCNNFNNETIWVTCSETSESSYGFTDAESKEESEWTNITIKNIKAVRIKDSSDYFITPDIDPWDDPDYFGE